MKILLAVDGSRYTKRMLAYLAAHDEWLAKRNSFMLLTVVPPLMNHPSRFVNEPTPAQQYEEQANTVLTSIKAFVDMQGWPVEAVHAVGTAGESIAHYADSHRFDLVIMGTHGHTALGNVLLGSVATHVVSRCKTPVLLVR